MAPTRGNGLESEQEARIAEAVARRVVAIARTELGLGAGEEDWIDSKEVARRFGLSRAWVYAHARRLGAVAIGDGPKPRLRFIPSVVAETLRAGAASSPPPADPEPTTTSPAPYVPRVRTKRSVSRHRHEEH